MVADSQTPCLSQTPLYFPSFGTRSLGKACRDNCDSADENAVDQQVGAPCLQGTAGLITWSSLVHVDSTVVTLSPLIGLSRLPPRDWQCPLHPLSPAAVLLSLSCIKERRQTLKESFLLSRAASGLALIWILLQQNREPSLLFVPVKRAVHGSLPLAARREYFRQHLVVTSWLLSSFPPFSFRFKKNHNLRICLWKVLTIWKPLVVLHFT